MYTRVSFFPVAFMRQFNKIGNVYWGLCVLLQFYKPIRTSNPIIVLLFVLFVVLVGVWKEWQSDSKRQQADRQVNCKCFMRVTKMKSADTSEIL
jgi:magnesium-transporting ATPase (P-type)